MTEMTLIESGMKFNSADTHISRFVGNLDLILFYPTMHMAVLSDVCNMVEGQISQDNSSPRINTATNVLWLPQN